MGVGEEGEGERMIGVGEEGEGERMMGVGEEGEGERMMGVGDRDSFISKFLGGEEKQPAGYSLFTHASMKTMVVCTVFC